VLGGTWGSETSQYPQEEKTICDSVSSGERKRMWLNLFRVIAGGRCGVGGVGRERVGSTDSAMLCVVLAEDFWKGSP
jgi:hypothetical protein